MAKVKAFRLPGYELEMYTAENINERPHFNLKDRQRGLELKIWIRTSTARLVDWVPVRPKNIRTGRAALDGQTGRILGQLIEKH